VTAEAIPGEDTPSESWCVQEEARTPLFNARATFTDWKKETLADFYHGEQIVEWMQNDIQSFCRLDVIHFFSSLYLIYSVQKIFVMMVILDAEGYGNKGPQTI
jgi:hypothetical protein